MASIPQKIRVLIVDDSAVARTYLTSGLSANEKIEVIGYAVNGADAQRKIDLLNPDVMTLDVEMPDMSGIDLLKKVLRTHRLPVILVSSLDLRVLDALAAGAVDFVRKPDGSRSREEFFRTLTQKIVVASLARVRPAPAPVPPTQPVGPVPPLGAGLTLDQAVIGLGASTGGTEATLEVLKRLPGDIPGMVVVQHMPPGFTQMYAQRLDRLCAMEVRQAADGDEIRRGLVLVAPADLQCTVIRVGNRYRVVCKPGDKVSGHRPSVDVLFSSMAKTVKNKMAGIILTGMGHDGSDGLLAMRKAGAYTIGQDRESSVVYGMPMVAFDIGAVQIQAPCERIAGVLLRQLKTW